MAKRVHYIHCLSAPTSYVASACCYLRNKQVTNKQLFDVVLVVFDKLYKLLNLNKHHQHVSGRGVQSEFNVLNKKITPQYSNTVSRLLADGDS